MVMSAVASLLKPIKNLNDGIYSSAAWNGSGFDDLIVALTANDARIHTVKLWQLVHADFLKLQEALKNNKVVTKLDIRVYPCSENMQPFSEILKQNTALRSLTLNTEQRWDDRYDQYLADALEVNKTLMELNCVHIENPKAIAAIKKALERNKALANTQPTLTANVNVGTQATSNTAVEIGKPLVNQYKNNSTKVNKEQDEYESITVAVKKGEVASVNKLLTEAVGPKSLTFSQLSDLIEVAADVEKTPDRKVIIHSLVEKLKTANNPNLAVTAVNYNK